MRVYEFIRPAARLRHALINSVQAGRDLTSLRAYAMERNKWWAARRIVANAHAHAPTPELRNLLCCHNETAFAIGFSRMLAPVDTSDA
jgi:hypothetical protein